MPNTYFQRLPLEEAINTIASNSKKCEICVTFHPEFIGNVLQFDNYDVLFTSGNKAEVTRQLKKAVACAKRCAGENCKNEDIPKFDNLIESKSDSYTIFIRYQK